jgi:membrane-bound lytic murein transglycosylase C
MSPQSRIAVLLLFLCFCLMCGSSLAAEDFDSLWQKAVQGQDAQWEEQEKEIQRQEAEFERLWQERKAEIEQKWDEALRSTNKEWVDYSPSLEARSYVNFREGFVEVTVVVPASDKHISSKSEKLIAEQIGRIFSRDNPSGTNVLQDQVTIEPNRLVSDSTLSKFIDKTKKKAVVAKKSFVAGDGIPRVKANLRFDLLPDHLEIRAKKYYDLVRTFGERFQVHPALILAVIHTESYFNPLAASHANAHGLMQLIPKYGAKDAYRKVYGRDRIVSPEYLYVPKNNVELGSAYLSLLRDESFNQIQEDIKRLYLVVCAYNWGPSAVTRRIVRRYDVGPMSSKELYQVLRRKTPKETSDYLQRVTDRMKIYAKIYD